MATQNYFKVKNGLEFPSIETLQTTDNTGPSIKPSLNLDFAKTKSLDPRITFSRASTATYYDGDTTALAEENLLTYSQDFSNAVWSNNYNVVTANAAVSPDGTSTANLIAPNASSGVNHRFTITPTINVGQYTFSVHVKAAGYRYVHIRCDTVYGVNKSGVCVDLNDGVILPGYYDGTTLANTPDSYSCVSAGGGWYRVSLTFTVTSGTTTYIAIQPSPSAISTMTGTLVGDGTSGIYAWGAQLEQRSYATAYTPTTSSPITNYIPVLQTAATNAARFDHDPVTGESKGLLIEESRSNMYLSSSELSSVYWNKTRSSLIGNAVTAPDGSNTACKFIEDTTASNSHYLYQPVSGFTSGTSYTYSIYVKKAERNQCAISFYNTYGTFTSGAANFDLITGTLTNKDASVSAATITPVGNGWYRITATSTATASANGNIAIHLASTTNTTAYTGDGISGLYVWGPQVEAGAFATSYIPTTLSYAGRGSVATYKGSNGLIQIASSNAVRYEPNIFGGSNLLLEGTTTNYSAYSATPSLAVPGQSDWNIGSSGTVWNNAGTAPDGSFTATRYVATGASYLINYPYNKSTLPANSTYVFSCWVKSNTSSSYSFVLAFEGSASDSSAGFTATTVWQRFYFVGTSGATPTASMFRPSIRSAGNAFDILVWGCQLELGSIPTSYVPSIETHTGRSSTATYYDSTGTIRTAASGQARYTYNPSLLSAPPKLMLEGAATNLQAYSIDGANGGWLGNGNSSTTETTTPNGLNSACVKLSSDASATPNTSTSALFSATSNNVYTYSIFVKPFGSHDVVSLWFDRGDGTIGCTSQFKLSTLQHMNMVTRGGMTFVSNSIQVLPGGWYRLSMTATGTFPTSCQIRIYVAQAANYGTNNDGYGTATGTIQSGSGMYAWGAQVELGYTATSYIPTTSAQVTRAADTSTSAVQTRAADVYSSSQVTRSGEFTSMTGSNFSSWWKKNEGTLYAEGTPVHPTAYTSNAMLIGTMADNRQAMELRYSGTDTSNIRCENVYNGSSNSSLNVSASGSRTRKIAYAFTPGDLAATCNAASPGTNSITAIDNPNVAYIGYTPAYNSTFNGTIRKVAYYPKRLSNAELVSITS